MKVLRSEKLGSFDGLIHGFSGRHIGADGPLLESSFKLPRIAQLKQIHSSNIIILENIDDHDDLTEGDSLITSLRGVGIGIRTADCVPILIVDKSKSIVAAVHAGWRGTLSEIASKTVNRIKSDYGVDPSDLVAAIGPSIKNCCYEVGEEVAAQFMEAFADSSEYLCNSGDSKYLLNLTTANRLMLESAGVGDIETVDICTKCNDNFYSYRREGKGVSTQLSFIALEEC